MLKKSETKKAEGSLKLNTIKFKPLEKLESETLFGTHTQLMKLSDFSFKPIDLKDLLKERIADPGKNLFDELPIDIKLLILGYLTFQELCRSASVSKHWKSLTSLDFLWKQFRVSGFSSLTLLEGPGSEKLNHKIDFGFRNLNIKTRLLKSDDIFRPHLEPTNEVRSSSLYKATLANLNSGEKVQRATERNKIIIEGNDPDPNKRFVIFK